MGIAATKFQGRDMSINGEEFHELYTFLLAQLGEARMLLVVLNPDDPTMLIAGNAGTEGTVRIAEKVVELMGKGCFIQMTQNNRN